MVSLGFDGKNSTIFQMISNLDEDGSGQIEFEEWMHLMVNRVSRNSSKEAINRCFDLYDDEKTGYISIKNLTRMAEEIKEEISEDQLQKMIEIADYDEDGLVSKDEFYNILTQPYKRRKIRL